MGRNKNKVIAGMSGGVDSAVCAYLLKKEGYDVEGVSLRTVESSRCCEIEDARKTAWKIGIRLHSPNYSDEFARKIITPFIDEYKNGRTPNPCVICNKCIKWDKLIYYADILGAEYVATGHYANVVKKANGRYTLRRAAHAEKDQTYMLYRLTQEQLKRTIMPLGNISKEEVRKIAKEANLPVADKKDSQEICFITEGDYSGFITKNELNNMGNGEFVHEDGTVAGTHNGIIHYTVGQRKGLGLALGYPVYVKEIRAKDNQIVISPEEGLYSSEIICDNLNFLSVQEPSCGEKFEATVRIRYHHAGEPAEIIMLEKGRAKIRFSSPVRAPAPGQSAVFYDDEGCVIGGGIIVKP
ncbi:MAG: tRNA 2-thiouridine(34) synthase MnmA [Clostridia bacterium]|nr:tRNA 2-thiouridine(34) synthase MnmA [Clostridia bacterium]